MACLFVLINDDFGCWKGYLKFLGLFDDWFAIVNNLIHECFSLLNQRWITLKEIKEYFLLTIWLSFYFLIYIIIIILKFIKVINSFITYTLFLKLRLFGLIVVEKIIYFVWLIIEYIIYFLGLIFICTWWLKISKTYVSVLDN